MNESSDYVSFLSPPPESTGRPPSPGSLPSNRTIKASDSLPSGHGQHHRPEDSGEGSKQEKTGEDGHPQRHGLGWQRAAM